MRDALIPAGVQPFCVVYVQGQGYGWMDIEEYEEAVKFAWDRVVLIASFETEALAKEAYSQLPQEWKDIEGLHLAGGEWWQTTGISAHNPEGQELELFIPADRPMPVFNASTGNKSC